MPTPGSSTSGTSRSRPRICSASSSTTSARTSPPGSTSEPGNGPTSARRRSSPRWSTVGSAWSRHRRSASAMTVPTETSSRTSSPHIGRRCPRSDATSSTATRFVDVVRQVVGVGSVGMRVYLVLLQGSRPDDLCFLQIKQAGPVGLRGVPRTEPLPEPRPTGDGRPALHPERHRHLRRLDQRCGHRLLRPPVPRHEGHPVRQSR